MNSSKMKDQEKLTLKKASNQLKIENEKFPINIPESQGDRADQAESQIEADLQEQIEQARHGKRPGNKFSKRG